jgi:hypothetical protein
MKSSLDFSKFSRYSLFPIVSALLLASSTVAAPSQQTQFSGGLGIVDDWTTHHVVFSNPGTFMDAVMNGRRQQWEQIVNDPRYRMQQIRRSAVTGNAEAASELPANSESQPVFERLGDNRFRRDRENDQTLGGAWTVSLSASGGGNIAFPEGMFAAKYTFAPIGAAACTDFVVFPINSAGKAAGSLSMTNGQADILGVDNLYTTTCSGTVPTVLFAYYFPAGGDGGTSPVLSLNGKMMAIVETLGSGANFHVITLDKSGNTGCTGAGSTPCNGDAAGTPVEPCTVIANGTSSSPCTYNAAVDNYVTLTDKDNITISSPFVDYIHDVAYVGDDKGVLHKITPVFTSTATNPPKEVSTGGWPVTVISGQQLTGPTYDSISGNIFVGAGNGLVYCVSTSAATAGLCTTASVTVGNGGGNGPILDPPIVDSTNQKVFATSNIASDSVLGQATTSMSGLVLASVGKNGNKIHNGAFDNAYLTSGPASGHMYFCGNDSSGNPMLYSFPFNSSGTMSTTSVGTFSLAQGGANCTPLTEFYNGTTDMLFLGVDNHGFGTTSGTTCNNAACIMMFTITSAFPTGGPTKFTTTNLGTMGTSGFIVDNGLSTTGASQIYFGNLNNSSGTQISQSGLN